MRNLYFLLSGILFFFNLSAQDPAGWRYNYAPYYRHIHAIHIVDTSTFVIAGGNETNDKIRSLSRSTDGGYSWDIILDLVDSSWLTAMKFLNPAVGFAVGFEGAVLKTTDGGKNWTHVAVPGNVQTRNFNSIFFLDAQTGFIAGGNKANDSIQTILRTTDGGATWQVKRDVLGPWLKTISFTDANNGYAAGANGVALKTTDGGETWNQMTLPGSAGSRTFNTVFFTDGNTGFLGGGNEMNDSIQTILKTTDSGTSWNIIADNVAPWISDIQFITGTKGFAVGDDGTVLVTEDGGDTWSNAGIPDTVDGGFTHHRVVNFQNSDFGVVAGTSGKLLFYNAPNPTGPIVQTTYASNLYVTNGATFNGTVNAQGNNTKVTFEYWTAVSATVNEVNAVPDSVSGNSTTPVHADVTGLNANTVYSVRAKTSSEHGVSYGDVRQVYIGSNPIPNFSFEEWDTITLFAPQQWISAGKVTQVTSYDGTHAVGLRGTARQEFGAIFFGLVGDNAVSGGQPFPARPDSIIGYFNYDIAPGDSAVVILWLSYNSAFISQDFHYITGSSGGNFERLSFPVTYTDNSTPDSIVLGILSTEALFSPVLDTLSYIEVDNISFAGTTVNVPNAGFEDWFMDTIENVTGWVDKDYTPIAGVNANVIKTRDREHGSFAVKLQSFTTGVPDNGSVTTGEWAPGFPVSYRHERLHLYLKYLPENNDSMEITVQMYLNGQAIGTGLFSDGETHTEYTPYVVPISYNGLDTPDSASITIRSSKTKSAPGHSALYADNLSFDGFFTTGIRENKIVSSKEFNWNLYPNPARGEVLLKGESEKMEKALLTVLNINGTVMKKEQAVLPAGNFSMNIPLEDLPNGIYLVTLQKEGVVEFRRLVVAR